MNNQIKINKKISPMRGFTLIELMIVVVIIGILAAIALPQYNQYIIKTRRVEAEGILIETTSYLERYYTETGFYKDAKIPFTTSPKNGAKKLYDIDVFYKDPQSFVLTAIPINSQIADINCGVLSIDQAATKCILRGTKCSDVIKEQRAVGECW